MRSLMIGAALVLAAGAATIAHAGGTACDQKTTGSTSYGDEASKTASTAEQANAQIKPGQKVSGSTSYGDQAAKPAKDKAANAQIASTGSQDCAQ